MRDKEKIFELLRAAAETSDEERYVEELICKVEKIMPPIEQIDNRHVHFVDRVYRRDSRNGYYEAHCSLHREIWRFFHGEIPADYEVHHRDLNRNNNDITNLELLTKAEHKKIHAANLKTCKCKVCGREFQTRSVGNKNRYCSKECRNEGACQRYLKKYTCEYCGREFEADKHHPHRFCSKVCAGLANRKITRETITCQVCGKEFTAKACAHRKYCSMQCYRKLRAGGGTEIRACPVCGKKFTTKISANQKYCSRECYNNRLKKH